MATGCYNNQNSSPQSVHLLLGQDEAPVLSPRHIPVLHQLSNGGQHCCTWAKAPMNEDAKRPMHVCPSTDERMGRNSRRCKRWAIAYVTCCVFSIITSVIASLLIFKYAEIQTITSNNNNKINGGNDLSPEQRRPLCVPCRNEDGTVKTGTTPSPQTICCDYDDARMEKLIIEGFKLSLQDRLKGEDLYNILNNPILPPRINLNAAHVFLSPSKRRYQSGHRNGQQSQDEYQVLRDWSDEASEAFIRRGIEFNRTKGHFQVKEGGIYVVYSRIVYTNSSTVNYDQTQHLQRVVLGHSISIQTRGSGGYRSLVEDEQAMECAVNTVCYNSKIFSTLHLSKNSEIAVRARQMSMVSSMVQLSYFGLYKID